MEKLDGKIFVPISWVFTAFGMMVSVTVIGSFWVSAVNFRLERIEDKLGIQPSHAEIKLGPLTSFRIDHNER